MVSPASKNIQRDLIGRLLPRSAFDQLNHAIKERFAGIRGDADFDFIGEHARAAGDRRAIAARFADNRSGFAGDCRFIHRSDAFDDFAVAGDELARGDRAPRSRRATQSWARLRSAAVLDAVRDGFAARLAQRIGLRLAAAFGHGFREIGKHHGEPEPQRDLQPPAEAAGVMHGCREPVE